MELNNAWNIYLKFKKKQKISCDENRWLHHIGTYFQGKELKEISSFDILEYQHGYLEPKDLSPKTIKECLSLILRIYRFAIKHSLYTGKIPEITFPKFDNRRTRYLSSEEAKLLINALTIKNQLWADITVFAVNTGLRASELFNLQQANIYTNNNATYITVVDTKSVLSRHIPLNKTAENVLNKHRLDIKNKRIKPYIFMRQRNDNLRFEKINFVSPIFADTVNQCGFNDGITDRRNRVVFHTLRHTYASWLMIEGVPIATVSKLMGHANIDMTMRYAHLSPENSQVCVSVLDKYLTKILK